MRISELFWNASLEELKKGYIHDDNYYTCLLCGKVLEEGIVYQDTTHFYEAERYMRHHIKRDHHSVFDYLIGLNKKLTGLTDHQNSLLQLFYTGKSDTEIQGELGIGSASTIRNHRFVLKEKERQAKVFLAMMELLKEQDKHGPTFVDVHTTARMIDERYNITTEESELILKKNFPEQLDGRLKTFALQEKHKLVVLREIVKRFKANRTYNEQEVNEVLKVIYDDFAVLRRYLIEYGFLDRTADGSRYWLKK